MKYIIALLFLFFILSPIEGFAQGQAALPKAGLVPGSPFYFLDKLGEAIQEFITFSPQAKARLQITFAAERVAEIKVVLETKGVEAKGLDVAQTRLQANIAKAASIVSVEKSKGKDVSALAQDLSDKFEAPKSALAETFKSQKQGLKAKEEELKTQLRAAHRAGDTSQEEVLARELGQVKAQKELLELKEEDIEDELEAEEEKIEEEIEAQRKAEKAINEAREEKQEVLDEAAEEGVELSADAFAEFDNLLSQAGAALEAGNFSEARRLAKQAEKSLEQIERTIEELEKKQELKEEAEEEIGEAEEEEQEEGKQAEKQSTKEETKKIELKEFEISGSEFSFSPSSITVKAGQKVKIKFRNHGGAVHNLIIEGLGIGTKTISPDDDASFEFTAPAPGIYAFFCSVFGHRALGMEGRLEIK